VKDGGKNEPSWETFIWAVKWWEVKGWGESVSTVCVGKNTGNCIQYFLTVGLFIFCTCCIVRCVVCIVVSCLVCIVVSCLVCIVVVGTSFSWFPSVYKQMLRWFPTFQVATTCFSCSPPDLSLLVTNFILYIHVK